MTNKKPAGVCDCGLCFDYNIVSEIPLVVKCKKCGKEPVHQGILIVNADEVTF